MASRNTQQARRLRRQSTDAEKALWRLLRNRQLAGHKFRRQVPIGRFIVDFLCQEQMLVIEIDGGKHQLREKADHTRTLWLEGHGYHVVRFWNNEVLAEPVAVQEAILAALEAAADGPSPRPSPTGRGRKI